MKTKARAFLRDSALLFAVAALDQAVKAAVRRAPENVTVYEGVFFSICRTENPGGAFGILSGHPKLVAAVSFFLIAALSLALYRGFALRRRFYRAAWILLFGGGVGNLADRLLRGTVTDYIRFRLFPFPLLNLADVFITAAGFLFAAGILWEGTGDERGRVA